MKIKRRINQKHLMKIQLLKKSSINKRRNKQIYKKRKMSRRKTPIKRKNSRNKNYKKRRVRSRVTLLLASLF